MLTRRKLIEDLASASVKVLPSASDYGQKICGVVLTHYNILIDNLVDYAGFEADMKALGYKISARYSEWNRNLKNMLKSPKNKVRYFKFVLNAGHL